MRLLVTGLKRVLVPLLTGLALLTPLLTVPAPAQASDPDWVFYTANKTRFTSPWYAGAHRIMVPFGCTAAPYYEPDERCEDGQGFHHGIDIAMNCGTKLYAGARARVVASTSLGTAYGEHPILLRNLKQGWDVVIGHARRVFVHEGQIVKKGQLIALASDDGAPDGCHLHFEKRAAFGDLSTATRPRKLLGLMAETPARAS